MVKVQKTLFCNKLVVAVLTSGMLLLFTACTFTEVPSDHTNPLDTIYDSGPLRMVLSYPEKSSAGYKMFYSSVYYNNSNSKDSVFSANGTPQLMYKATAVTQTDLDNIKNMVALTGYTLVKSIVAIADDYKGEYENSTISSGTYVIQFPYKLTNNATVTTGIFYSNIVSYNP